MSKDKFSLDTWQKHVQFAKSHILNSMAVPSTLLYSKGAPDVPKTSLPPLSGQYRFAQGIAQTFRSLPFEYQDWELAELLYMAGERFERRLMARAVHRKMRIR